MKMMSPLDPVSINTLVVFSLTGSLLLAQLVGSPSLRRCFKNLNRGFLAEQPKQCLQRIYKHTRVISSPLWSMPIMASDQNSKKG
jgi:hypothetical protein